MEIFVSEKSQTWLFWPKLNKQVRLAYKNECLSSRRKFVDYRNINDNEITLHQFNVRLIVLYKNKRVL